MKPKESNKITRSAIIYNTMFSGSQGKVIGTRECCLLVKNQRKERAGKVEKQSRCTDFSGCRED